ncbi:MAG: DUF2207 domain-containing protein [Chloroflexota bacterium]
MRRRRVGSLVAAGWALLLVLMATLVFQAPAFGQEKRFLWEAIDVDIQVASNGDLQVRERQVFRFLTGSFSHAYRDFGATSFDELRDVQVSEESTTYSEGRDAPRSFAVTRQVLDGRTSWRVEWWFDPTEGAVRTFDLSYTAVSGVRRSAALATIEWTAVGSDRGAPVRQASVTMNLPADVPATATWPASRGVLSDGGRFINGRTYRWLATDVAAGQALAVSLGVPSQVIGGGMGRWQQAEEAVARYDMVVRPMLNVVAAAAFFAAVAAAVLAVAMLPRIFSGQSTSVAAAVGPEPPDDLPPAMAALLVDRQLDDRHLLSTILDFARRDIVQIDQVAGGSGGVSHEFRLRRERPDTGPLWEYERHLLYALFPRESDTVCAADAAGAIRTRSRDWDDVVCREAVARDLLTADPRSRGGAFRAVGIAVIAIGMVGTIASALWVSRWVDLAALPFIGAIVGGVILLAAGRVLPRWGRDGLPRVPSWRGYRDWLSAVPAGGAHLTGEQFERALPFAVAFGMDAAWIPVVGRSDVVQADWMPFWYSHHASTVSGRIGSVMEAIPPEVRAELVRGLLILATEVLRAATSGAANGGRRPLVGGSATSVRSDSIGGGAAS